jgi:hypothetical protein
MDIIDIAISIVIDAIIGISFGFVQNLQLNLHASNLFAPSTMQF